MKQRNHTFDFLCGICILRMVTLHAACITEIRQEEWWKTLMYWSFYMMSFFFFKAGYFNKGVHGKTHEYCFDKFKRLMIPYFSWGAISAIIYITFITLFPTQLHRSVEAFHNFRWTVGGFTLGNRPLWFLLSFFTSYMIVHFIEKVRHLHWVILVFPLLSYWLYTMDNPGWFYLNNVFFGAFFFFLGKVWNWFLDVMGRKTGLVVSIVLTLLFCWMNVYHHGAYEMCPNDWKGPFWAVVASEVTALTGISGILLTIRLPRIPIINYVGEHSMVYYVSHYCLMLSYSFICVLLGHKLKHNMLDFLLLAALAFLICTLLVKPVERIAWLSGRWPKKKS